MSGCSWLTSWSYMVTSQRGRVLIPVTYLTLVVSGMYWALQFPGNTSHGFEPPPSTDAFKANQILAREFPQLTHQPIIVLGQCNVQARCGDMVHSVRAVEFHERLMSWSTASAIDMTINDVFTFAHRNLSLIGKQFVAANQSILLFAIEYRSDRAGMGRTLVYELQDMCRSVSDESMLFRVTGMDALTAEVSDSASRDLLATDGISIPCALVIMAFLLGNTFLIILPVLALFTSIVLSFAILYAISTIYAFSSSAPPIAMSLQVALSIDYSLFILKRFDQELSKGLSHENAVRISIHGAGRVIMTSGAALALTFLSLCLFPTDIFSSVGVAATISIVLSILISLTLTPALLVMWWPVMRRKAAKYSTWSPKWSIKFDIWPLLARWTTWTPGAIISVVTVLALVLPVAWQAQYLQVSIDSAQVYPRSSQALATLNHFRQYYRAGKIAPFRIVQLAPKNCTIMSTHVWNDAQELIALLVDNDFIDKDGILAISYVPRMMPTTKPDFASVLTPSLAEWILQNPSQLPENIGYAYVYLYSEMVSSGATSTIIELDLKVDPLSDAASSAMKSIKRMITQRDPVVAEYYLAGSTVTAIDTIDTVFASWFPVLLAVSVVMFIFLIFEFKSLFIPVRTMCTIGLSVTWPLGLAVLLIQNGWLSSHVTKFESIHSLYWLTVVMIIPITGGLGLDYDIFLMERILELQLQGGKTSAACIREGTASTGSVISVAGLIMSVAFGGLVLSDIDSVAEIGLGIVTAVLFDTFIVRVFLVPSTMFLAGRWACWPRFQSPISAKTTPEFQDPLLAVNSDEVD